VLLKVFNDRVVLGQAAARQAAAAIRRAVAERGYARIIAATAASQLEFLDALTKAPGIDWSKVEVFHLDEYIGLPLSHPGSFRKMLLEQLVQKTGIVNYHLLDGDAADPSEVVHHVGKQLASVPVDIAFLGIGENGHIAFNDPPADFKTEEPYIIVNLDEACRQQQVGEAWFAHVSQVPEQAISMSARQILKAKEILAVVPGPRKALALRARSAPWRRLRFCALIRMPPSILTRTQLRSWAPPCRMVSTRVHQPTNCRSRLALEARFARNNAC